MGAPGGGRAHLRRLLAQEGGEDLVLHLIALKDRECSTTHRASVNTPCGERYGGLRDFRRSRKPCRHTVVIPLATSATIVGTRSTRRGALHRLVGARGGRSWH
jgi:hypothetical protein